MDNFKNSYIVEEKELVSLSVSNVGHEKCHPGYQWGPGVRDHYLIHYVAKGKGRYEVNGQWVELSAGDCFLVYPKSIVTYQADEKDPWEYAWVGFTGSDAKLILQATDFSQESPYLKDLSYGQEVYEKLLSIYEVRGNDFRNQVQMTGRLYEFFALLMENAKRKNEGDQTAAYIQKSVDFITANYSSSIKVQDIADFVGLSRSQLFRVFMQGLGISPKDYLSDYRIRQAKYMLKQTEYPVQTIANSVGFENSLYFSKAFHAKCGCSPREYRNKKGAKS